MNPYLKEINEIISICNDMSAHIDKFGCICFGNPTYENYKMKIAAFLKEHELDRKDYGAFEVLDMFWYNNRSFSLNSNEIDPEISTDRRVAIEAELREIEALNSGERVVKFMRHEYDIVNRNALCKKVLEMQDEVMPLVLRRFRTSAQTVIY